MKYRNSAIFVLFSVVFFQILILFFIPEKMLMNSEIKKFLDLALGDVGLVKVFSLKSRYPTQFSFAIEILYILFPIFTICCALSPFKDSYKKSSSADPSVLNGKNLFVISFLIINAGILWVIHSGSLLEIYGDVNTRREISAIAILGNKFHFFVFTVFNFVANAVLSALSIGLIFALSKRGR